MNTLNVVESVFFAALEKDTPEARAAFLDEACKGDANLRRCVQRLLDAHPKAEGFMQAPAPGLPVTTEHAPLSEKPGSVIGPYKLLQELGEGGFGTVFMAEQSEPVRRKVALKVIKPGMDSKQVVARFEQERQALAMMDHPNIARVFDGGTTDSGRPYFVMELVKGIPITTFCDENRLTPRQRLELFASVCQAIQHAHQKGIIHRDIKPSNVLVTLYDDKPVVKVIDFGVAKAIEQKLTEGTLFTRVGQVIGTLEYMSPEQASLNALDVDTRSDVYALGVLLYELLTGSTPLDRDKARTAGFMEMLRLIREEEPLRPSDRLSGSGEGLPSLAASRKTESQKLPRLVRGELDWIALRALEKDRARRYDTAQALAADVHRYLNDETVEACPPSLLYRAGKFARKHKAAFTLAGTAAVLLLLGAIVSGWQAVRAMNAEHDALVERDKAHQMQQRADEEAETARRERDAAKAAREEVRSTQYAQAIQLALAAWQSDDARRAIELLDEVRPRPGEVDLRGWEWRYLDRLLHQQRCTVPLGDRARSPAVSADGRVAAFWQVIDEREDCALKVVESATGKLLFSHKGPFPHEWEFSNFRGPLVAVSRDGKRVAALTLQRRRGRTSNVVWDVATGKQLLAQPAGAGGFALSPDGSLLASIEDAPLPPGYEPPGVPMPLRPQLVKVWNLADPEREPVQCEVIQAGVIRELTISPDGKRIASFCDLAYLADSRVVVWDAKSGKRLGDHATDLSGSALAFSPDGKLLTGVGSSRDSNGKDQSHSFLLDCSADAVEEMHSAALQVGSHSPWGQYKGLAYAPEGKRLAFWHSSTPTVRIIDYASGKSIQTVRFTSPPVAAGFDRDGKRLWTLTSTQPGFRQSGSLVWQEWDATVRAPVKGEKAQWADVVEWSRDRERQVIFNRSGGAITVRDRDGKLIHNYTGHEGQGRVAFISPNGRRVLSLSSTENRVWDADTGKILWNEDDPTAEPTRPRPASAWASPDRRFLRLMNDKGLKVVLFDDLSERFSLDRNAYVEFSPDGRRLVAEYPVAVQNKTPVEKKARKDRRSERECQLWDVEKGQVIGTFRTSGRLTFSSDGRAFVTTNSAETEATVWDAITGEKRATMKSAVRVFYNLQIDGDGKYLLGNAGERFFNENDVPAAVWDVASGKELFRLEGMPRIGTMYAISPDGKRIAGVTHRPGNCRFVLWETATGRRILTVELAEGERGGPLRFSDDGHRLMTWEVASREQVIFDATPRAEGK